MRATLSLFLILAGYAGLKGQTPLVNGWKKTFHDPGVMNGAMDIIEYDGYYYALTLDFNPSTTGLANRALTVFKLTPDGNVVSRRSFSNDTTKWIGHGYGGYHRELTLLNNRLYVLVGQFNKYGNPDVNMRVYKLNTDLALMDSGVYFPPDTGY